MCAQLEKAFETFQLFYISTLLVPCVYLTSQSLNFHIYMLGNKIALLYLCVKLYLLKLVKGFTVRTYDTL